MRQTSKDALQGLTKARTAQRRDGVRLKVAGRVGRLLAPSTAQPFATQPRSKPAAEWNLVTLTRDSRRSVSSLERPEQPLRRPTRASASSTCRRCRRVLHFDNRTAFAQPLNSSCHSPSSGISRSTLKNPPPPPSSGRLETSSGLAWVVRSHVSPPQGAFGIADQP